MACVIIMWLNTCFAHEFELRIGSNSAKLGLLNVEKEYLILMDYRFPWTLEEH